MVCTENYNQEVKSIINIGAGRIVFCLKFFNDSLSFRKIKFELFKDFEENKIQFFVKKFLSLGRIRIRTSKILDPHPDFLKSDSQL